MTTEAELFKEEKYEELWERCCGFIDLSMDQFMAIHRQGTTLLVATHSQDLLNYCGGKKRIVLDRGMLAGFF